MRQTMVNFLKKIFKRKKPVKYTYAEGYCNRDGLCSKAEGYCSVDYSRPFMVTGCYNGERKVVKTKTFRGERI